MNTQAQVHRLEAGQALSPSRASRGHAVLAEGELLVQAPMEWLAGSVVVPDPVRLVAPAVLDLDASHSFVAVRASAVVVPQAAPRVTAAKWPGRVAGLLGAWRSSRPSFSLQTRHASD